MGTASTDRTAAPPAFLSVAGHPLRWRLLGELGRSDRTVHELTDLVDQPQNLVSYHLAKLRAAELVSARRSSADRRGTYYSVELTRVRDLLAATGTALHPGLLLGPPPVDTADPGPGPTGIRARVLFLCTGNSARSPMAEALARTRSGGRVEARSAGSHPKAIHPDAVRAMREVHGIDLAGHRPTHLDELADRRFDRVVTLCDRVREVCPDLADLAGDPEAGAAHWSIPNPTDDPDGYPAFRQVATELGIRIGFLLTGLLHHPSPPQEDP